MKNNLFTLTAWLGVVALLAGALTGCASVAQGAELRSNKARLAPNASDADLAELASGNSAFAIELYQALRQRGGGNLFYSPYSISAALAMTFAGARGETERQMVTTLHYTLPQARLHPAFNALDASLTSQAKEETFQLNIANAIWGQKDFAFLPIFLDTLAENYGAGLRTVDFANATEAARQAINTWVSDQTKGKIKDLIPQGLLDSSVRLVLTNAIYFKGKWVMPFEKNNTHDGAFTLLDGGTVSVPMMRQTNSFKYAEGEGYQAVELAYRDSDAAMLVVLPQAGRFDEIEAAFSTGLPARIITDLEPRPVVLTLPKFTYESEFQLADVLAQMGMPAAFGDADFSGMTGKRDLFISEVVHKAFVAVDEEGTEAAAATAVVMKETAMMLDGIEMEVDRPFLFLIRDTRTGTILFVGRVLNPES
jgi:serpin B